MFKKEMSRKEQSAWATRKKLKPHTVPQLHRAVG